MKDEKDIIKKLVDNFRNTLENEFTDTIERILCDKLGKNDKYSEKIEDFWSYLMRYKYEAKEVLDSYKEDKLTFNIIEAEGYYRGLTTVIG